MLLEKDTMTLSLKNKIIAGGKQWSLQNLENPATFDNRLCFRLGYSKSLGLDQQMQGMSAEERQGSEEQ